MAVPYQPALREGLDSGRYAPSVHPLTPRRYQPESVRSAPTPSSEVGHFRLPQMRHELRLDLVYGGFEGSGAFLLKWV